tara:strand:+ start:137 stop:976 length:840 start_codon:yes stop_codon:yes gene_type:complete
MKLKHNKKRNTAFLYETLIVELTKAVVKNDHGTKQFIVATLKEHFKPSTILWEDLQFYKALSEPAELDPYTAEKLLFEVKKDRSQINPKTLFTEQSRLIRKINRNLSKSVYSNFVPGYRSLATISQIFNHDLTTKQRVLLEKELMKILSSSAEQPQTEVKQVEPIDSLSYKIFVNKFNEQYGTGLLEEQQTLLNNYVMSVADNGLRLRVYLNEELYRLRSVVGDSLMLNEVKSDPKMVEATQEVIRLIESFKSKAEIDEKMLRRILDIQNLASEIQNGD